MRDNGFRASGYVALADLHPQLADAMLEVLAHEGWIRRICWPINPNTSKTKCFSTAVFIF